MTARAIHNIGGQSVSYLSGDEVIRVESASQTIKLIRVKDLQRFLGGDVEVPSVALEKGAHPAKMSAFPNAEFEFGPDDVITGVQGGQNVNFHLGQLLNPLMNVVRELVAEEVAKALKK